MALDPQQSLGSFGVLPYELVVKVMAELTLQARFYFIKAYPQYKYLGQASSLKTRSIKRSNICFRKQDLQWLLDPNGVAIELSLDRKALTRTYLDVASLMPNLQEVTLKNCRFHLPSCSTITDQQRNSARKFINELGKVKILNFDSCSCFTRPNFDNFCWLDLVTNDYYLSLDLRKIPKIVTFHGMVPTYFFLFFLVGLSDLEEPLYSHLKDAQIMVKDLDGNSVDLGRYIFETQGPDFDRANRSVMALNKAMDYQRPEDHPRMFLKLKIIQRNDPFLPEIEITGDFDMTKLKTEIQSMSHD